MAIDPNEKYALMGSQVTDLATKIKTAQSTADGAVTALSGKQDTLSTAQLNAVNSGITSADVTKLSGIAAGAEVNVQADWSVSDNNSDAFIKNKPTIPAAQVQADWDQSNSGAIDYIKNKPVIPPGSVLYGETGQHTDGAMTQKAATDSFAVITVTSTDPGEGAALAANNFIAYYEAI